MTAAPIVYPQRRATDVLRIPRPSTPLSSEILAQMIRTQISTLALYETDVEVDLLVNDILRNARDNLAVILSRVRGGER